MLTTIRYGVSGQGRNSRSANRSTWLYGSTAEWDGGQRRVSRLVAGTASPSQLWSRAAISSPRSSPLRAASAGARRGSVIRAASELNLCRSLVPDVTWIQAQGSKRPATVRGSNARSQGRCASGRSGSGLRVARRQRSRRLVDQRLRRFSQQVWAALCRLVHQSEWASWPPPDVWIRAFAKARPLEHGFGPASGHSTCPHILDCRFTPWRYVVPARPPPRFLPQRSVIPRRTGSVAPQLVAGPSPHGLPPIRVRERHPGRGHGRAYGRWGRRGWRGRRRTGPRQRVTARGNGRPRGRASAQHKRRVMD